MRNYRSSCNSLFLFYTNQVYPQNRLKTNHLEGNTGNIYHDTLRIENHGQEKSAVCMRLAVHHAGHHRWNKRMGSVSNMKLFSHKSGVVSQR